MIHFILGISRTHCAPGRLSYGTVMVGPASRMQHAQNYPMAGAMEMKAILLIMAILFAGFLFMVWGASHGTQSERQAVPDEKIAGLPRATFAGGCFWCTEADFEKLEGVVMVISGYTGGHVENPRYEAVSAGGTGHVEAVQVIYDPEKIGYKDLLDYFWKHIDPTDSGGQFVDRGPQYRSAIFYHDEEQKRLAEESKREKKVF